MLFPCLLDSGQRLGLEEYLAGAEEQAVTDTKKVQEKRKVTTALDGIPAHLFTAKSVPRFAAASQHSLLLSPTVFWHPMPLILCWCSVGLGPFQSGLRCCTVYSRWDDTGFPRVHHQPGLPLMSRYAEHISGQVVVSPTTCASFAGGVCGT